LPIFKAVQSFIHTLFWTWVRFPPGPQNLAYICVMSEKDIQRKRIKELEKQGYYVIKLVKTNKNGIPDIVAIPPNSGVIFSEIKKPNTGPSELQKFRLKELNQFGIKTEIYDGEIRDPKTYLGS